MVSAAENTDSKNGGLELQEGRREPPKAWIWDSIISTVLRWSKESHSLPCFFNCSSITIIPNFPPLLPPSPTLPLSQSNPTLVSMGPLYNFKG